MKLGDLLELMHGASGRFESVESQWRSWRDVELTRAAFAAHAKDSGAVTSQVVVGSGDRPTEEEETIRLWLQRPDRVREERDSKLHGKTLAIQVGSTWWSYWPGRGAMTNAGDAAQSQTVGQSVETMLNPAPVIGLLDIEIRGTGERAGRSVVRARCSPRPRGTNHPDTFALRGLSIGADAYDLEIDTERGILLRVEACFDGAAMMVVEAVEIAFDRQLDPELFRFVSPDGQEPSTTEQMRRLRGPVALHESVSAVPFTVYALRDVSEDWELHVSLHRGSKRPVAEPSVWLNYTSRDRGGQVNIGQLPATAVEDYRVQDGEDIERDGLEMRVRRRTDMWPQAQLSVELDGTLITMSSDTLTAEDLIDLSGRLVPASSDPPKI